ncbi:retrotransposon protein, putative, ty1-copia subclass [Tanacetum coccineum]
MSFSNTNDSSMYAVSNKRAKLNLDSSLLWHCRLGHISKKRIKKLQHDGLLNSSDIELLAKCVSCMLGKMARKPYSHQVERAKNLLGLIHTDVCGLFRIVSRQGSNYFITFTDDFSWYGYVYLLKHKHEVFETFKVFQKEVENQLGKTIKSLRSDHDYALESAARILNMVPTKKVDKTPYEIWHGQAPKLSYLKVWGCKALVKRDTLTKPDKLEPRSFKCIFIGYPKETMGYSFYNPSEKKVFVARNAKFFESNLIDQQASGSLKDLEIIQEEDTNRSLDTSLNHEANDQEIDEPQSDINPIRRSTKARHPRDRLCLYIDAEEC